MPLRIGRFACMCFCFVLLCLFVCFILFCLFVYLFFGLLAYLLVLLSGLHSFHTFTLNNLTWSSLSSYKDSTISAIQTGIHRSHLSGIFSHILHNPNHIFMLFSRPNKTMWTSKKCFAKLAQYTNHPKSLMVLFTI